MVKEKRITEKQLNIIYEALDKGLEKAGFILPDHDGGGEDAQPVEEQEKQSVKKDEGWYTIVLSMALVGGLSSGIFMVAVLSMALGLAAMFFSVFLAVVLVNRYVPLRVLEVK